MTLPNATPVVPRINDADPPSSINEFAGDNKYVGWVGLVSLINVDAEEVFEVTVRVSEPSVRRSAAIGMEIVALPAESIVTEPLSCPLAMSPLVIPEPDSV